MESQELLLRQLSRAWPKSLFNDVLWLLGHKYIGFAIDDVTVHFTLDNMRVEVFELSGKSNTTLIKWPQTKEDFLNNLVSIAGAKIIRPQVKLNYQSSIKDTTTLTNKIK